MYDDDYEDEDEDEDSRWQTEVTSKRQVIDYLVSEIGLDEDKAIDLVGKYDADVQRGISFRSYVSYVGDTIAQSEEGK